jgi:hypothetical protein
MIAAIWIFLQSPQGRAVALAAAAFAAIWLVVDYIGDRREAEVRAQTEQRQQKAREDAIRAAGNASNCHDLRGRWVQSTGRCVLPGVPSP